MSFLESPLYLVAILALVLFLSDRLCKKRVFKVFGIALVVIVLGAVFTNTGLLPSRANPTYDFIFDTIAPASLFLLLLDVNLMQLKKTGFPILLLFLLGSFGTVAGVLLAMVIIPDSPLFEGMYHPISGMLAGTYTGGSINFNAVALHYRVMEHGLIYTSAVAVDNVLTTLWFFVTISLPVILGRMIPLNTRFKKMPETTQALPVVEDNSAVLSISSLSLWIGVCALALLLTELVRSGLLEIGWDIPSMVILTSLALFMAQIPALHRLKGNMFLGSWGIYLFLAVVGAYCDLGALVDAGQLAVMLLIFVTITVMVHGLLIFLGCYLLRYDWEMAAIASQANVGGGTTAMALAKNFGRNELILPAILIGSLGNGLGTYIGFLVAGMI